MGKKSSTLSPQPLQAAWYAGLSILALAIAMLVGWYLLNKPTLLTTDETAARAYYVLLVVLGLASAAFLFGAMRSTARITGHQIGAAYEFSGPAAMAIAVVVGGFILVRSPADFSFTLRLRVPDHPITDASDTWARVDMGQRRDERQFSSNGEAIFSGVPEKFISTELPIELLSKTFEVKDPKSAYKIPANMVLYLDVIRKSTSDHRIELGNNTLIAHFIGEPIVGFNIKMISEMEKPLDVSDLSLEIKSPTGSTFDLLAAAMSSTQKSNDLSIAPSNFRVHRGDPYSAYFWWARMPWQMLGVTLTSEIKQLPEYMATDRWPCWQESKLSDVATKMTQEEFQRAFIWSAGSWTLSLSGTMSGKSFLIPWIIELTSAEVDSMKSVARLYHQCVAINTQSMLMADIPPFVEKPNRQGVTPTLATGN